MLKSNRYLLLAACCGLIAVGALLIYYRSLALATLVHHETRSNVALTEAFANSIWPGYREFVGNAHQRGDALSAAPELARLDRDVRRLMRGSHVIKVKIYDLGGLTVYSSDPAQIGQKKPDNAGFVAAREGDTPSAVTFRERFDAFEGTISDRNVVSSYVPIRARASGRAQAVLEVYSDVTELVRDLHQLQWRIALGAIGSLTLIYALLTLVARRAHAAERLRGEEALRNEARMRYQAYHDPVTGLANRTSFYEQLAQAIHRAERRGRPLAVMFLDLDRFKLVNDSFGHDAGDELLRLVGTRLRACARDSDQLFRVGGDEFTLVPEDLELPEDAVRIASRVLRAMEQPFVIKGHSVVLGTSIGISLYPRDDRDPAKLVKNADAAMYMAKDGGRNRYQFYTPELNARALEQLELESSLQQALARNEFVLHYQPRLDADAARIVGAEALLRWQRDGELVPPGRFVAVLERTGLIQAAGQWVLYEACRQNRAWQDAGHAPVRVSVNVSPHQFRADDFVGQVERVLGDSGLAPQWLELELSESVLVDDPQQAIDVMTRLKALGIRISIDDFGTGYSSFKYLKALPVDYLKIDRAFVRDVNQGEREAAIVHAIAAVARSLGIGLVAEGVEDDAQARALVAEGCVELQGFLYSAPLPGADLLPWLQGAVAESGRQAAARRHPV